MSDCLHCDIHEMLEVHLQAERYSGSVQRNYPSLARRFLDYLESKTVAVEAVRSLDVENFLRREHRLLRKRHGQALPFREWRWRYTGAIHMVLRLVHGGWPIAAVPGTALEAFHRDIVQEYDAWLHELRGLLPVTRSKRPDYCWRGYSTSHAADSTGSPRQRRRFGWTIPGPPRCCSRLRRPPSHATD